jgi:hypothetical protein
VNHRATVFVIAALVLMAPTAFAQNQTPPARLAGTIEKFNHDVLTVRTGMGPAIVAVTPKTKISGVAARKLSDIEPNDFIGVTAVQSKDGTLHATEVHIFPPPMRGVGEGHRPMGRPDTTMTNAAVTGIVKSSDGENFTLSYKDRETGKMARIKIDIAPTIPIVAFVPGDKGLLKPGASLVIFAGKKPNGDYVAFAIVAEKNGVKPPM